MKSYKNYVASFLACFLKILSIMKQILTAIIVLLLHTNIFAQRAKTIAVLPFQAFISGNIPAGTSASVLEQQRWNDGVFQQQIMVAQLNRLNHKRRFAKKNIRVLSAEEVNGIIQKQNLYIADLYTKSDAELAQIFGVDLIVKGRTDRVHNMSPEASAAIYASTAVINGITQNRTPVIAIPPVQGFTSCHLSNVVQNRNLYTSRVNTFARRAAKKMLKAIQ
jgi:hypothetical protein